MWNDDRYITVKQYSSYIQKIFESEVMLHNISIVGEISSFSITNNIAYFNIKDEDALLQCALFNADKSDNYKIGDKVIVSGKPNYYIKGGKLTFNCFSIKPYGLGELYKQFNELKSRLEKEGIFDIEHKKQKPSIIKRIGIVTSKNGAVLQDIINIATRRDNSVDLILFPVKVQGIDAEKEIAEGIEFFNDYDVDAVIVARGGGSIEDLQPFNTEIVARAVYNSSKFIVSAVGHETDYTIIDYAADLRASTPSVAAELLVKDVSKELELLYKNFNHCLSVAKEVISYKYNLVINYYNNIERQFENYLNFKKNILKTMFNNVNEASLKYFSDVEKNILLLLNTIERMNPISILKQGYSKILKDDRIVKSIEDVNINDELEVKMIDGKIKMIVLNKERL